MKWNGKRGLRRLKSIKTSNRTSQVGWKFRLGWEQRAPYREIENGLLYSRCAALSKILWPSWRFYLEVFNPLRKSRARSGVRARALRRRFPHKLRMQRKRLTCKSGKYRRVLAARISRGIGSTQLRISAKLFRSARFVGLQSARSFCAPE